MVIGITKQTYWNIPMIIKTEFEFQKVKHVGLHMEMMTSYHIVFHNNLYKLEIIFKKLKSLRGLPDHELFTRIMLVLQDCVYHFFFIFFQFNIF